MDRIQQFFEEVIEMFAQEAGYYFSLTIPFFVLFWVVGKRFFAGRRIQPVQRANGKQFRDEILISLGFVLLYAVLDVLLLKSNANPIETDPTFKIYTDLDEHGGPLYAVFTCFMLFVINDTWFYWMHRAMHHPWLYKHIHSVHHKSIDTTPFAAFRFHPVEGLLEIAPGFLSLLYASLFPVHLGALVIWQTGQFLFNVIGHSGYEIYPATWNDHWFLKWKTPSTHHNMHHEQFNGNYGLYFTWWDRLMGTEFNDYEARYRALFKRDKPNPDNADHSGEPSGVVATMQLRRGATTQSVGIQAGETLLAAALRQNVAVPYLCQRGRCGTCQAQCVAGQVRLNESQTYLSPEAIRAGHILLCQSIPTTAELTVAV